MVADREPAVLVTGISGRFGRRLCRVLHREMRVMGIDERPFPDRPKDVDHHQLDLRRKKAQDVFRGASGPISAVVHLGVLHDSHRDRTDVHAWNVAAFSKIIEYVAQYRIPKLVVLSSADVYGPQPDNAQFLGEEAPLLGGLRIPEVRDLVEIDMVAQSFFWKRPETETVVLRPVHILGHVHNAPSSYLRLPVIPTLLGFDPMVQVIHEDDAVHAIQLALRPGVRGIFNVAGPEPLPVSRLVRATGRPSLPVPHWVARRMLDQLAGAKVWKFPTPELDHIRYVCMVDDQRARSELGFAPRRTIEDAITAVLEG